MGKAFWKAPGEPATVQAAPLPWTNPAELTCRHWAEEKEFKVREPVMVELPLNKEFPTTSKVEEGTSVPTPTRLSLASTTKVLSVESTINPERNVEVAVAESTTWKSLVPASEMKFRMFPVWLVVFKTPLKKSPVVKAELEAVKTLLVTAVEEAAKKAVSPALGLKVATVLPAFARVKELVTLKVLSMVEEPVT